MYENLATYFLKCLDKQKEKLKEYESQEKQFIMIQNLLRSISYENVDFLELKRLIIAINKKELNNVIPKLERINNLKEYINQIDADIQNIDINNLKTLLSASSVNKAENERIFDILSTIKAVYGLIKNPAFSDEEFKNMILEKKNNVLNDLYKILDDLFSPVKEDIRNFCNFILVKNFARTSFSKKDTEQTILKLERCMLIFDENGIKTHFSNSEEMNDFFNEIKHSDLQDEEKANLILEFSKYNVEYYNKLIEARNLSIQNQVMKNTDNIIESMEKMSIVTSKDHAIQKFVPQENQDKKIKLSDEDSKIVVQVKQAIEQHFNGENYDSDFLEIFEEDYISSREGYYYIGNKLNWSVIATDVKYILEPNLQVNQEEVVKKFRYILEVIKTYEIKKEETDKKIEKIKSINSMINNIIGDRSGVLKYWENMTEHYSNFSAICDYIRQNDLDSAKICLSNNDIPLIFFQYIVILQELIKLSSVIKSIGEELELFVDDESIFNPFIEKAKLLFNLEEANRSSFDEFFSSLYTGAQKSDEIDYSTNKNIVYYMFDDFSSFDSEQRSELQETTKVLLNTRWYDIKDNKHFKESLFHKKQNGERSYYKDEGLDAYRIWAKPGTRTGIIKINVCEENQLKIFNQYGLERMNTLILVIDVIHSVGQDHEEYDSLTGFIDKNINRINEIKNIFANPKCDEKELFDIVDKAIKSSNKVANGIFNEKHIG